MQPAEGSIVPRSRSINDESVVLRMKVEQFMHKKLKVSFFIVRNGKLFNYCLDLKQCLSTSGWATQGDTAVQWVQCRAQTTNLIKYCLNTCWFPKSEYIQNVLSPSDHTVIIMLNFCPAGTFHAEPGSLIHMQRVVLDSLVERWYGGIDGSFNNLQEQFAFTATPQGRISVQWGDMRG